MWFDRRTNYTRSLAVMSMVGYVLGLGDRHPSNLMLDRLTGCIIHIDFGDCFEVSSNQFIITINLFYKHLSGGHAQREISRKDSISIDTDVN